MNLGTTISIFAGGPGSGCNPAVGKCGRSVTLYHGTSSIHVNSIRKNGIQPDKGGAEGDPVSKTGHVYLSHEKESAKMWARFRAANVGGKPVVLKVNVPSEHYGKLKGDTFRGKPTGGGDVRFKGSVPSKWVK